MSDFFLRIVASLLYSICEQKISHMLGSSNRSISSCYMHCCHGNNLIGCHLFIVASQAGDGDTEGKDTGQIICIQ